MYQPAQVFINGRYQVTGTITPTHGIEDEAETVLHITPVGSIIEVKQGENVWSFTRTERGLSRATHRFESDAPRGRATEARRAPRGGSTRRISDRAPTMTPESVMRIATELSRKVGGSAPDLIDGGFRWSDQNVAAKFTTYSPEYNQDVVVVVSVFADGTITQDFFSSENLSETDRYENIIHFLYGTVDLDEMAADLEWVWERVDRYAASWQEEDGLDEPVVRDYEAIDRRDRRVAGPFKHYSDARREADRVGGAVRFVPGQRRDGGSNTPREPRRPMRRRVRRPR